METSTALLEHPRASTVDLLVEMLKNNQVWADLAEAFNAVIDLNVDDLIRELERIRFITQDSDQELLKTTARMLGFDASQDVMNLNSDNLTRLVSQLPLYPDQNSTKYFSNFIDVLLNSSISVDYLYTEDYVNFYDEPTGPLITEGGSWFKTTHIGLTIALLSLSTLLLRPGQTLLGRAKELFYEYAPIPLVVERITFAVVLEEVTFGVAATLAGGDAYIILD